MKKYFFILVTLFSCLAAGADNIRFRASAPGSVVLGQQFRVEYTVNGDGKEFRTADFDGFDVLMGPSTSSSMSTQIINGKVSSETSKTYTYILMGNKEGAYKIPSATVKVNGRQYTSNDLSVKVLPADKASQAQGAASQGADNAAAAGVGANDVMVRLHLSKTKVYEGEALVATMKLYTVNPQTQLSDAKYPGFDGFTAQEIDLPDQKSYELEHLNGRNYYAVTLRQWLLFPQRAGKIEIAPATLDLAIPVRVQQKMRSLFDDFFDNYQTVNKTVSSGKQVVDVTALPFGKPTTFMGGIGDFKMTSSISTNELKANEALTLKLTISGNGNLKFIKDPELKLPADFEAFDPKVDLNIKATTSGVTGSKTIEYTMIPRYAGDFEIPSVEFSYFDLKTKEYKTLATPVYKVKVAKGAAGDNAGGNVTNFSAANQENVKLLGSDIRFIKSGNLGLHKQESFFFGSIGFYLSYIIPFLLFVIAFVVYRKQVKENANMALMRTKKANKVASKRLKLAAKYLKEHQKESFYDELLKAVWGYLSDKLNMPLSVLTRDNVETELKEHGVDEALIKEFMEIVATCEFARYAPAQNDEAMDQLYASTVEAIGKMENVIRK
ncbi:MAG: BatD family protein [Bacteroidales bacterium]